MWKIIILCYIAIGLAIILSLSGRRVVRSETGDINKGRYPAWKVIGFFSIIYSVTVLLWPLFLPQLLSKKKTALDEFNEHPIIQEQASSFDLMEFLGQVDVGDNVPGAVGEFGLVASNPIPCHWFGAKTYFNHLRTHDGNTVIYKYIDVVRDDVCVRRQNLLDQEPSYLRDTLAHLFS